MRGHLLALVCVACLMRACPAAPALAVCSFTNAHPLFDAGAYLTLSLTSQWDVTAYGSDTVGFGQTSWFRCRTETPFFLRIYGADDAVLAVNFLPRVSCQAVNMISFEPSLIGSSAYRVHMDTGVAPIPDGVVRLMFLNSGHPSGVRFEVQRPDSVWQFPYPNTPVLFGRSSIRDVTAEPASTQRYRVRSDSGELLAVSSWFNTSGRDALTTIQLHLIANGTFRELLVVRACTSANCTVCPPPTMAPTQQPTPPTATPTHHPTGSPSPHPTPAPTTAPTHRVTAQPSRAPTTSAPTPAPTGEDTAVLVQTVEYSMNPARYSGDLKQVVENGYTYSIGMSTLGGGLIPGCSITSSASQRRSGSSVVEFKSVVVMASAAFTVAQSHQLTASALAQNTVRAMFLHTPQVSLPQVQEVHAPTVLREAGQGSAANPKESGSSILVPVLIGGLVVVIVLVGVGLYVVCRQTGAKQLEARVIQVPERRAGRRSQQRGPRASRGTRAPPEYEGSPEYEVVAHPNEPPPEYREVEAQDSTETGHSDGESETNPLAQNPEAEGAGHGEM